MKKIKRINLLTGIFAFLLISSFGILATPASAQTALGPPTNLTATAVSSSQINLSWTAPASDGGSAITGYKIERSTDGGTNWSTLVANTGSTSTAYSDSGLSPGTTYTYRVSAITLVLTSSPSNTASATTKPLPPATPTGVTATQKTSTEITISWTASAGATFYQVFNSTSSSGPFVKFGG